MTDTIAIKVADGSLKPVLNTAAAARKRVVLSPESDAQQRVVLEFYQGIGKEVFDQQLLDIISIDGIPARARDDLEIALNLSIDDNHVLNIRVTVEGTDFALGRTYDLKGGFQPVDLSEYTIGSDVTTVESASPQAAETAGPIDNEFVLGIEPYISYDRADVRKHEWQKKKEKIRKGFKISTFFLYVLLVLAGLLLFSFFVYLGITLPPLPPLES